MIPVARTENILLTEVDNEVMIYDRENDSCHCLNPVAAQVWRYCDGYNTVDDIANLLEQEMELPEDSDMDIRGLVWLALEELERCNLIKEYVREPIPDEVGVSRRKVLGKTAKFAGVVAIGTLFPMVQSIVRKNRRLWLLWGSCHHYSSTKPTIKSRLYSVTGYCPA
jgi:hypothetical protein